MTLGFNVSVLPAVHELTDRSWMINASCGVGWCGVAWRCVVVVVVVVVTHRTWAQPSANHENVPDPFAPVQSPVRHARPHDDARLGRRCCPAIYSSWLLDVFVISRGFVRPPLIRSFVRLFVCVLFACFADTNTLGTRTSRRQPCLDTALAAVRPSRVGWALSISSCSSSSLMHHVWQRSSHLCLNRATVLCNTHNNSAFCAVCLLSLIHI